MNRERSHGLAVALVLTSVATLVLGASTLSGFSSAPGGDMAVTSMSVTTNLLLVMGAVVLLGLEFAHAHSRTGSKAARPAVRASEA